MLAFRAGLGLLAGAVFYAPAVAAQRPARDTTRTGRDTMVAPIPPSPDSIVGDSSAVPLPRRRAARDTVGAGDTLVSPLARAELPVLTELEGRLRFDRRALHATGALTLADLLDRVPGLTTLRARWITAPMAGAYLGDAGAVRVFLDGLELETLDARNGGVLDLSTFQLWTLDEVAVERGAAEVRVYMRTWRGDTRTSPATRVDVLTGDEDTNLYRGFFSRRFRNGLALQAQAQQFSTEAPRGRSGGDGDALSIGARLGYARGRFSMDGYVHRTRRTRNELTPSQDPRVASDGTEAIPPLDATDQDAYLRLGIGDPERGGWVQAVAATRRFIEVGNTVDSTTAVNTGVPLNVVDTSLSRAQYVAGAGYSRGPVRASVTGRLRLFEGETYLSPSARLAFDRRRLALSLYAENDAVEERLRVEAMARLLPTSFIALTGAVSQRGAGPTLLVPDGDSGFVAFEQLATQAARGEVALRLGRLWVGGGVVLRDAAVLLAPTVFDRMLVAVADGRATGTLATIHGRIFKDVGVEAHGVRWNEADTFYRPQFQSRARLFLDTEWRRRFPTGTFSLLAAVQHEYRSHVYVPYAGGEAVPATQNRALSTQLELRIVDAVVFWQFRNVLGERYSTVPGLEMPRPINLYGVRWEFRN